MSVGIKETLTNLTAGALFQRLAQAAAVVLLARGLGVEQLGAYAFGLQLGALLALLVNAGPRLVAAREAAADPQKAWAWVQASIRTRLVRAAGVYAVYVAAVLALASNPLFFLLCGAQVFLGIFDLKGLAEALGLTRFEVVLEGIGSALYLLLLSFLLICGGASLGALAGAFLVGRFAYAFLAVVRLPLLGPYAGPIPERSTAGSTGLSVAFLLHGLIRSCDVLLLRWMIGPGPAGLFHAAHRIALASEAPLQLLIRLTRPYINRAGIKGRLTATLERTLRANAFWTLPIAASGWLIAPELLSTVFDEEFRQGAWTLRWLLLATFIAGIGGDLGSALFSLRRVTPYLVNLAITMALNLGLSIWFIPIWGSAGSALATALALAAGVGLNSWRLGKEGCPAFASTLVRPCLVALVTVSATAAIPAHFGLLARLASGALGLFLSIYALEIRGRWRKLGLALENASGFSAERNEACRGPVTRPE